jgi:hypothetical protein
MPTPTPIPALAAVGRPCEEVVGMPVLVWKDVVGVEVGEDAKGAVKDAAKDVARDVVGDVVEDVVEDVIGVTPIVSASMTPFFASQQVALSSPPQHQLPSLQRDTAAFPIAS